MTQNCRCIGVKEALHLAFHDRTPPACAEHDVDPGVDLAPTALNNDAALAAKILGSLPTTN